MKTLNKITLSLIAFFGVLAPTKTLQRTSAAVIDSSLVRTFIDYGQDDYAYLHAYNHDGTELPEHTVETGGVALKTQFMLFGFDSADKNNPIETINRMGFRISYRIPDNFFHKVGNWWNSLWDNPPKYGSIHTEAIMVKANQELTFAFPTFSNGHPLGDGLEKYYKRPDDLHFPAIGKMSDLFKAEEAATLYTDELKNAKQPPSTANVYWVDTYKNYGLGTTGGYKYEMIPTGKLNDSSKSFAKREFYAAIYFPFLEEIGPETIDCYMFDGTHVSDGLNEDGEAYIEDDPVSPNNGEKYIDVVVSKDRGIAINGTNAKLKSIKVEGYSSINKTLVFLENGGGYDNENSKTTNIKHKFLLSDNGTKDLNWTITNQNRYIIVDWDKSSTNASEIKIRFYYETDNDNVAWKLNLTDKDGNFLPEPIKPDPGRDKGLAELHLKDLILIISIIIAMVLILAIAYDFMKTAIFTRRN